jgi:hypothetical protein
MQKGLQVQGTKYWSREKIAGLGGCFGKKDSRIRGTKE